MSEYEPELGQAIFGQPSQQYKTPPMLLAALSTIDNELCGAMWNLHQERYESPFWNTGNRFKCDTFEVEAYSWNDEYEQPYNFKWKDIEISWYKHMGRGMSVNKKLTNDRIAEMLGDCLKAISKLEKEGSNA